MSGILEQLIAALNANTAALNGAAAPAADKKADAPAADKKEDGAARKPGRPAGSGKKAEAAAPTISRSELAAELGLLRDEKGADVAKSLIKEVGGVAKLAEVADDKVDALYKASQAARGEGDDAGDGDDDGL
jgi:hypothetical protein